MFVIHRNSVDKVRVSSNGNLIADHYDLIGRQGEEPRWPKMYDSEAEAESILAEIVANCDHEWKMIDHDERECTDCGAIEVVPDL